MFFFEKKQPLSHICHLVSAADQTAVSITRSEYLKIGFLAVGPYTNC